MNVSSVSRLILIARNEYKKDESFPRYHMITTRTARIHYLGPRNINVLPPSMVVRNFAIACASLACPSLSGVVELAKEIQAPALEYHSAIPSQVYSHVLHLQSPHPEIIKSVLRIYASTSRPYRQKML